MSKLNGHSNSDITIFDVSKKQTISIDIARMLNITPGKISTSRFIDSETSTDTEDNIRGKEVFVMASHERSFPETRLALEYALYSIHSGSCERTTVILPYMFCSRGERRSKPKQVIPAVALANMFKSTGVDRVATIDIHSEVIGSIYEMGGMRLDNLTLIPVYAAYWAQEMLKHPDRRYIIASPDEGGGKRANAHLEEITNNYPLHLTDRNFVIFSKERKKDNQAEPVRHLAEAYKDLEGSHIVLFDDMGDSLGTLIKRGRILKLEHKVAAVYLNYTHAIHSVDKEGIDANDKLLKAINEGFIDRAVISDTVAIREDVAAHEKVTIIPCAPLLTDYIRQVTEKGGSVSKLHKFDYVVNTLYKNHPLFNRRG